MPKILILVASLLAFSCSHSRLNPVFSSPEEPLPQGELLFLSESAQDTHQKFELRTATGEIFLDRVLCPRRVPGSKRTVQNFPVSYGLSPGRFNVDLDPLDLIVLGSPGVYQRMASAGNLEPRRVRVIGMLKFDECENVPCKQEAQWANDWKVFAVDVEDPAYAEVRETRDLPEADRYRVTEFFSNYKGAKRGPDGVEHPQTRVTGFLSREEAMKLVAKSFPVLSKKERSSEIERCEARYGEIAKLRPEPLAKDENYLGCLQRVRNRLALPGSAHFDYFLRFDAGQRLLELGEKNVTLASSLKRMQERKEMGKTHYRFVDRDMPSPPGTGAPIFEWVKTKSRNDGCPEGTPAQHYETRPLLDVVQ